MSREVLSGPLRTNQFSHQKEHSIRKKHQKVLLVTSLLVKTVRESFSKFDFELRKKSMHV